MQKKINKQILITASRTGSVASFCCCFSTEYSFLGLHEANMAFWAIKKKRHFAHCQELKREVEQKRSRSNRLTGANCTFPIFEYAHTHMVCHIDKVTPYGRPPTEMTRQSNHACALCNLISGTKFQKETSNSIRGMIKEEN